MCTNLTATAASDARREAIGSYTPWLIVNHLAPSIDAHDKLLADILQCFQNIDDEELQTHTSYPMLLDISGQLAKMLGNEELAASQNGKAEMIYQMRAWLTQYRNFVNWLFKPEGKLSGERLRWAVSHFEDLEFMFSALGL